MCYIVTGTRGDQRTRPEITMMKCLVSAANRGGCTCPSFNGMLLHPNGRTREGEAAKGQSDVMSEAICSSHAAFTGDKTNSAGDY